MSTLLDLEADCSMMLEIMNHRLVVISGYDSRKVFPLSENHLTFGRDGQNSVVLDHPRVSRRHCSFRVTGEQAFVEDLGSTNFTFRNHHPVPSNVPVEIRHNDRFKIDLLRLAYLKGDNREEAISLMKADQDRVRKSARIGIEHESEMLPMMDKTIVEEVLILAAVFNRTGDNAELQAWLLRAVLGIIRCDRAAIFVKDTGPDAWAVETYRELDPEYGDEPFPTNHDLKAEVLRDGSPLLSNDGDSVIVAPLSVNGEPIGVIYAQNSAPDAFDRADLRLLLLLATIVAVPLKTKREMEWLKVQYQELLADVRGHNGTIVGGATIRKVLQAIEDVAPADVPVLITGESGTGKELAARAIHERSPRANKPFIAINCGALPEELKESELFGYEKGAFTGAIKSFVGKIEQANEGTLFLDEVGELSLRGQVMLLRFLQDHCFERLGGTRTIHADVRVIAATNRDLKQMINEGKFRLDLYYRLKVVQVRMPPLAERSEDIPLLTAHFIEKHVRNARQHVSGITLEAQRLLAARPWPGNIRELENTVMGALVFARTGIIHPEDVQKALAEPPPFGLDGDESYEEGTLRAQRWMVQNALAKKDGNVTGAAELLKMDRGNLHRLIKKLL